MSKMTWTFGQWILACYVCASLGFLLLVAGVERLQTHWALVTAFLNIIGSAVALVIYVANNKSHVVLKKREVFQQLAFWGSLLFFKGMYFYVFAVALLFYLIGIFRIRQNEKASGSPLSLFQTLLLLSGCGASAYLTFGSFIFLGAVSALLTLIAAWRVRFFLTHRPKNETPAVVTNGTSP